MYLFKIFDWAINAEKKVLPISYDGKTATDPLLMKSDQLPQNGLDKFRLLLQKERNWTYSALRRKKIPSFLPSFTHDNSLFLVVMRAWSLLCVILI